MPRYTDNVDSPSSHLPLKRGIQHQPSPYKRPPPQQVNSGTPSNVVHSPTSPQGTLGRIWGMVSAMKNSIIGQDTSLPLHNRDVRQQKSESGSEDEWTGDGPNGAGGLALDEVRNMPQPIVERRASSPEKSGRKAKRPYNIEPGEAIAPSPKRQQSALNPLRSFPYRRNQPTSPSARSTTSQSASSAALKAFLDAKNGTPLDADDLNIIDSLTSIARTESERPQSQTGGWAAGSYTPQSFRRNRAAGPSSLVTPVKPSSPATSPTSAIRSPGFSIGTGMSPARVGTPGSGRRTYLGVGWDAKRIGRLNSSLSNRSGMSLELDLDPPRGSTPPSTRKKARREDGEDVSMTDRDQTPSRPPALGLFSPPAQDHAENQITEAQSSARKDPVTKGKSKAADIMMEVLEEVIGPIEKKDPARDIGVINPYQTSTPVPYNQIPAVSSETPRGTPSRKSHRSLKLSTSGSTPLRGAAKRLEEAKSIPTPMKGKTVLQMFEKSAESPAPKLREDRTKERDSRKEGAGNKPSESTANSSGEPVEKNNEQQPPAERQKSSKPMFENPPPVQPLQAPQLVSKPLSFTSNISSAPTSFTPPQSSTTSSTTSAVPSKFQPSPIIPPTKDDEPSSSLNLFSRPNGSTTDSSKKASGVWLSAKDSALAVTKEALPFFTFTIPILKSILPPLSIKAEVEKASMKVYDFTVEETKDKTPVGNWSCSTCSLFNNDSVQICEACESKRPIPASTQSNGSSNAPNGGFSFPKSAASSSKWTCSTCMLLNDEQGQEKCGICEAPRSVPSAAPTQAETKDKAKSSGGDWTCGLCMLKNVERGQEKCDICETPR